MSFHVHECSLFNNASLNNKKSLTHTENLFPRAKSGQKQTGKEYQALELFFSSFPIPILSAPAELLLAMEREKKWKSRVKPSSFRVQVEVSFFSGHSTLEKFSSFASFARDFTALKPSKSNKVNLI
jgi:hypothetical protein